MLMLPSQTWNRAPTINLQILQIEAGNFSIEFNCSMYPVFKGYFEAGNFLFNGLSPPVDSKFSEANKFVFSVFLAQRHALVCTQ